MHPLQVIKETIDGVEDLNTRIAAVSLLNAEGHNQLHPRDQIQLPSCADPNVRAVRREIGQKLGMRMSDLTEEVSELLASVRLNDNTDFTVFFAMQE
tara:strand:- start:88048 stop:88338 length:291 start_codon:yes stop_codon:yes gene_type:complete